MHCAGIVIAGALAAVALAPRLRDPGDEPVGLARRRPPHVILPSRIAHPPSGTMPTAGAARRIAMKAKAVASREARPKSSRSRPELVAALKAGLPRSRRGGARRGARGRRRALVATRSRRGIARATRRRARSSRGAAFVGVNVDQDGGAVRVAHDGARQAAGRAGDARLHAAAATLVHDADRLQRSHDDSAGRREREATLPPPATGTAMPGPAKVSA